MSHEATNWAFKQRGLKPSAKIVLLALANRHNPNHGCFPSKKTLAEDCEMSERAVYDQIKMLVERRLVHVSDAPTAVRGRFQSNRYYLSFEADFPTKNLPSAKSAVGKVELPPSAKSAYDRRQNLPTNPVIEPFKGTSKERDQGAGEVLEVLLKFASEGAARSFMAYRRKQKAGALTLAAAKRLAASLALISKMGHDPDDALGMAEERGWQTIKPDWYFKEIANGSDRASSRSSKLKAQSSKPTAQRPENRTDAALEQIARLAGLA